MPSFASFTDPNTYHILTYGTLLGSNFFQSFMNGPIAFRNLPRPQFSQLQQAIFPPYFIMQTALPIVLALTYPGEKLAGAAGAVVRRDGGYTALLDNTNLWRVTVPIGLMFLTSLVNLTLLGPATTKVMLERKHQETRDGRRYYEPGHQSDTMHKLNSRFSSLHGAASLSNLVGFFAMLYYGASLAEKL